MLEPISESKQALIVKNVLKACKDINKLNETGYRFIHLACGFIAHYNLEGFKDYYDGTSYFRTLKNDILALKANNQWDNFREGDINYEYYMSRKKVYNLIYQNLMYKRSKLNLEEIN